jgi:hypothetical protein
MLCCLLRLLFRGSSSLVVGVCFQEWPETETVSSIAREFFGKDGTVTHAPTSQKAKL